VKNRVCVTLFVVCLAALGSTGRTQVAGTLPAPWKSQDIGAVGQPGGASESGGVFTVSGAGNDVWGTSDAFHFAYQPLSGDGTVVAEVASILGTQAWTKMGVMIRASTQANAAYAFMLVSTGKGLAFQRRTASGVLATTTAGGSGTAPRWVKLTRAGSTITAYTSGDGQVWTKVGSDTFAMPSTALVGLAAHSHDTTRLATATFAHVQVTPAARPSMERLQVSANARFLRQQTSGKHVFYLADTGWALFKKLNRADADAYLKDCAAKGFNAVQAVALWQVGSSSSINAYGDHPLVRINNRYDPAQIVTTPGSDPADPAAYDYWDHVDYVLDRAAHYGLYVMFAPTWGYYVSGTNSYALDMSSNIFTVANARAYGEFMGRRYGARTNVIWMIGGDRSAVYDNGDFRPVWRSLVEGVGRGATGQSPTWSQPHLAWDRLLMTYHPRKRDSPGSSLWFHDDPWLDFNGIQSEYNAIVNKTRTDWNRTPTKPTLLIEGRYEGEVSGDKILFTGAYKQRYQMYHAILAGSLGYAYGNGRIWNMLTTDETWKTALNDPGRVSLGMVWSLLGGFTDAQLFGRVPDQALLDGSVGTATAEDLLVAMRGGDRKFALVYSTNGRNIRVVASMLAAGTADAFWWSPRTGKFYTGGGSQTTTPFARIATGAGAPIAVFDPPGAAGTGNDWMLKLVVR